MAESQESERNYLYIWKDEADRKTLQALFDAVKSKDPKLVRQAGIDFAKSQYGFTLDDLSDRARFPRWINSKELETHPELGENSFVLFVPEKSLRRKEPDAPFLKEKFNPANDRDWWWVFKYDETGVLKSGGRLVDYYSGLPPEEQDEPDNPTLN